MKIRLLLIGILFLNNVQAAFEDAEPLPPDQAFNLSTKVIDENTLRAEWIIADGYYLYRDKFKFKTDTDGISLSNPSFPKGKIKEDEFFGKVETYRNSVAINVPINRSNAKTTTMDLITVSQGCADMGLCYPPQTITVRLDLPAAPAAPSEHSINEESSAFKALKDLGASLGLVQTEKFLQPEQAFVYTSEVQDAQTIIARWEIADGYYLYKDKFKFELLQAQDISLGSPLLPQGEIKNDEYFGKMEVYHNTIEIRVPVLRKGTQPVDFTLVSKFQGCAEAGFCYPPQIQEMPLKMPAFIKTAAASLTQQESSAPPPSPNMVVSEQDQIAASLASGNMLLTILSFFGFGLLLAFTPCVFPMIPILSSIIVGQGSSITTSKAFILSFIYVLAMALTYTIAGIVAGLFGENLQAAFQNTWIIASFSMVFVLLSFSMFGFYELQMPSFIQSRLTEFSNRQQGGTLAGVGIMGILSALIVGPCVAAPLAGALIYIGQSGDAVLGGFALFALSMGMGAPLLVIGTSAGKILPRAGTWMDTIKAVFGVMMLGVAIWMLERILDPSIIMLLWAALLIVSAIYLGALENIRPEQSGWNRLWKGLGILFLIYGVVLIIGAVSGGKDYLQPLDHLAGRGIVKSVNDNSHMVFNKIKSSQDLDREIQIATAQNKPIMLDFYADWCVSCKEMEKFTFSDPKVQTLLSKAVLLQADVTLNDDVDKELLKRFNLIGPPSILFFSKNGDEQKNFRIVGYLKADKFHQIASQALGLL